MNGKRIALAVGVAAFFAAFPVQAEAVTWDIPLTNGWNLIAIPVQPVDPAVGGVFADLIGQGALDAVWSYDATTEEWSAFVVGSTVPGLPVLTQIETGRGYWVKAIGSPLLTITSTDPVVPTGTLSELERAWNLVASSADEPKPYDRVFAAVPVREIWSYDAQGGVFEGVVLPSSGAGSPLREDFTDLEPDRGYWVLVDQSQSGTVPFGPDLGSSAAGDIDVMPLLPPPASPGTRVTWPALTAGDEDIGLDGFYDSPITQRAVTFRDVTELQSIAVFNEGTGVLSYAATIDDQSPLCGAVQNSPLPWLSFREIDPVTGELFDLPAATGSVATESATLTLSANRTELTPGLYCAAVAIATNSVSGDVDDTPRTVLAYIEIPPLVGDYELIATIEEIDGKRADTHNPRFFMSLYEDADGLKAILDAERTLLIPQRVRMIGDVYQDQTNRFVISGSFALPASDPANPYDTTLRRDITFTARRRERADPPGSGFGPLDLVGEYGETIRGPLGEDNPIYLSGTLSGRRADPTPSVFDEAEAQSLVIKAIPDGGTAEYTLDITDPRLITEIGATLDVSHPSPADMWIRLEPPAILGIGELTLRRASDNAVGLISFEDTETAVDDLSVLSGLAAIGTWTLRVEDEVINGQAGQVNSSKLTVKGTRVVSVLGNIAGVGADADVTLTGCGLVLNVATDASGDFLFENVIDCAYRVSVQADGFERVSADVIIGPTDSDAIVNLAPGPGPPVPPPTETNVGLPCEDDGGGTCIGLRFVSLSTSAGAGALMPRQQLSYVMDTGTFDIDRPPLGSIGPEDSVLFSAAENPVTLTNACVTPFDPLVQSSTCIEPGDGTVDPAVGENSMRAYLAIGGSVIGTSVGGSMRMTVGANP